MASLKQLMSNRQNALKSTGPRTMEGKMVVSKNAIKHGILCHEVFIPEEMQEVFLTLRESFYLELQPNGSLESFLVDRVVNCAWRLALLTKIEKEMFKEESSWARSKIKAAFEEFSSNHMATISRYEHAIERSFYKALDEFRKAQSNRLHSLQRHLSKLALFRKKSYFFRV